METRTVYDYLVIGAGPAGLQLGYFLEKYGHNYLILERHIAPAAFFRNYPRNRKLISFNKTASLYHDPEIKLRWDWNSLLSDHEFLFENYSQRLYPHADDMVRYLSDFASRYALKIHYGVKVTRIARTESELFCVQDEAGCAYHCRCLIVATGLSQPYIPPIPGIEQVEAYETVNMDAESFRNQRVLILGKGNSGFEIADNLLETAALIHLASPDPIKFAWNTRHPGNLRGDYVRILDAYQLKLLHGMLDCTISQIQREHGKYVVRVHYVHADSEVEEIIYDRVIRCTGFRFDPTIFDPSCTPQLTINARFPAQTPLWESTNVPHLFFAGTLMQVRDFRKSSSAFVDGFRYNIRTLYHYLAHRYHRQTQPHRTLPLTVEALAQAVQTRVCSTSALWAQFGYLCDLMVVDETRQQVQHFFELPVDHICASPWSQHHHYYMLTFEWGPWEGDVFAIARQPHAQTAYTNAFLHPILRRYTGDTLVAEHHILEDLFGMYAAAGSPGIYKSRSGRSVQQYHAEEHEQPLRQFFTRQLSISGRTPLTV
jgi:thioredoxin reductase